MTEVLNPGFETTDDPNTIVIKGVKSCDFCQGSVDRFCWPIADKHVIYRTKYFQCQKCGAMGDPFLGMMQTPFKLD